jgi:hypothetical protein
MAEKKKNYWKNILPGFFGEVGYGGGEWGRNGKAEGKMTKDTYNLSTQDAEAGGFQVGGLYQIKKKKLRKK